MIDEAIFWWGLASFMTSWVAMGLAYAIIRATRHFERRRRPSNGPLPIYLPRVSVATDLTPLISGLEREGIPFRDSQLWIFGSDGRYVVKSQKKRWRKELADWSAKGLRAKYILLEAERDVREAIRELKTKMGASFEAVCLAEGAVPEVARELETCHPTLFIGPGDNNAAWIERLHPTDSVYAYDVKCVSPKAMMARRERKEFESYRRKLELVLDNSVPISNFPGQLHQ